MRVHVLRVAVLIGLDGLAKYEGKVAHQETEFYEKAGQGRGGKVKYRNTSRLCQQGCLTADNHRTISYLETVYETTFTGEVLTSADSWGSIQKKIDKELRAKTHQSLKNIYLPFTRSYHGSRSGIQP